jgi:organic radical activating enzyme
MVPVSEIFKSIQGEGPFAGTPSVFLRLAFCNLKCQWCDTEYTWKGNIKYINMGVEEIKKKISIYNISHLVITGGEPLLWQKKLLYLIEELIEEGFLIEIETNGTISPILRQKIHYNISPKLSNSGEERDNRIKLDVLKSFLEVEKYIFKFVVEREEDIGEIMELKEKIGIPRYKIWLMPQSKSLENLKEKKKEVFQLSKKYGFKFSDRLQLILKIR